MQMSRRRLLAAGVQITELVVNPGAAAKMGVAIPDAVIAKAKEVVK